MSKIIDSLYSPMKKALGKVNQFIHDKIGVNIAKYSLLSTMIIVWAAVAFFEVSKAYTWEVGVGLGVIVLIVIAYDVIKTYKKKLDKENR